MNREYWIAVGVVVGFVVSILSYSFILSTSFVGYSPTGDEITVKIVGSTDTSYYNITSVDTPREVLDDLGIDYEVRNDTLYRVEDDYNSRSMHWMIYHDDGTVGLDDDISGDIEFRYESYMEGV